MRRRALIFAVEEGDAGTVRNLLEKGVDPNAEEGWWRCEGDRCHYFASDGDGSRGPPLSIAVQIGHADVIKQLVKAGANVNAVYETDGVGDLTPLLIAAQEGHAEVVKLLLEAGADANSKIYYCGHYCLPALGRALAEGHKDVVEMLLSAGADYGDDKNRVDPAMVVAAAEGGFSDIVKRMLEAGARPDPDKRLARGYVTGFPQQLVVDYWERTALIAAAEHGDTETLKLLLDAGANLDLVDYSDLTALGKALSNGHTDVADLLRKAGAKKIKRGVSASGDKWTTIDDAEAVSALKQKWADSTFNTLRTSLDRYRDDVGRYPTTDEGLVTLVEQPPNAPNWKGPYIEVERVKDKRIRDPSGQEYHYKSPGDHGEFDLYSLGADNAEGGEGENKDIVSWKEVDTTVQEDTAPTQSTEESTTAAQEFESNTPSPTPTAEAPKVQVGDTYIVESAYRSDPTLNNTTERRVLSVSDDRIDVVSKNIKSKTGKERMLQFTPEWNLVASRNSDGSGVDFSPPLKYFCGTDISWYAPNLRRSVKSLVTSRDMQGRVEEQVIQVVRYDLK